MTDEFITKNLPLVRVIADSVRRTLPNHIEADELVSAGFDGLLSASRRFDSGLKVKFNVFASPRIRGAMQDWLRSTNDPLSRTERTFLNRYEAARAKLLTANPTADPTEEQIAEAMDTTVEKLRKRLTYRKFVSFSEIPANSDHDDVTPEFEDSRTRPDAAYHLKQRREILFDCIRRLEPRKRRILTFYYVDEMTMRDIGEILGVNESRISQIHRDILGELASLLRMKGVCMERRTVARCRLLGPKYFKGRE